MKWAMALFPKKALAKGVNDINSLPGDEVCFNHHKRTNSATPHTPTHAHTHTHAHPRGSYMLGWLGTALDSE